MGRLLPPRTPLHGRFCRVEPLNAERHAAELHKANSQDRDGRMWTYLPWGPYAGYDEYRAAIETGLRRENYITYAVIDAASGKPAGVASYLNIPSIRTVSEISIYCGAMMGAGIGFLWYNTYPAQVFMGDVGSLALGGGLGMCAVFTKNELLSVILGGVFFIEAVSVVVQVASFRLTGKRIFLMAPIHHHYEKKGWAEPKIIVRFWIISVLLALVGLSSLKLR